MISDYVINENNQTISTNMIAISMYDSDCHNCQYVLAQPPAITSDTQLYSEPGQISGALGWTTATYIPYASIIPPINKCTNLLVPWSLSASHVSFCRIRLENIFMQISSAAGAAAALCIRNNYKVQDLPYSMLFPYIYTTPLLDLQLTNINTSVSPRTFTLIPTSFNPSKYQGYKMSFMKQNIYISGSIIYFSGSPTMIVNIPSSVLTSDINNNLITANIYGTSDNSPTLASTYDTNYKMILFNINPAPAHGGGYKKKTTRKNHYKKVYIQ